MIAPIPYFESKGIDYHLPGEKNVTRGWVNIQCPFPGCGDPSWHLGINLESELFNCYICGTKGHFVKLIVQIEGCSYSRAESLLNTLSKGSNQGLDGFKPLTLYKDIRKGVLPLESTDLFPDLHLEYLLSRGFDPNFLIPKYKLKATTNTGKFKFRIIIPYFLGSKIVSFTGRDVTGQSFLKYKDCPPEASIIPVKDTVYNIDSVKDRVLVVEGPLDVWRIGDGAVATSTFNFNNRQLLLLKNLARNGVNTCFVMYDPEERANPKAQKFIKAMSTCFNHTEVLTLEGSSDPGEMPEGEVRHLRKELGL